MAESWPTGIPSVFQASGYGFDAQSGVIRSDMETGPAKVRRRFTAVTENHKGTIIMSKSEFATWKSWFENVIVFGTLPFIMTSPITDASMTVRMIIPTKGTAYSFVPENGTDKGVLSFQIEELP